MTEPMNVASIVATAMQGARSRIEWAAEGEGVPAEEKQALYDLVSDLEGWDTRCA